MKFSVPDMSCGHCAATIEKAVKTVDASASVTCDLEKHLVEVGTSTTPEAMAAAIREAGYEAGHVPG
ncbi:heavy-metal-associated domain-containing protein [Roseibium sp. Sym1]|uniref:heavy-metal-associated domain-containing protein n=1 Tax=Roseibium sp. Sym1 TaxID=3016006 RepID=UPI0022B2C4B0|nr:heavy-metal-associated domain-containing protein [Roseibium sp. Sym1]